MWLSYFSIIRSSFTKYLSRIDELTITKEREKLREERKDELDLDEIVYINQEISKLEENFKNTLNQEKAALKDDTSSDLKHREIEQWLNKAEKMVNIANAGINIYNICKKHESAIDAIDEAIRKNEETIKKLDEFEDAINSYSKDSNGSPFTKNDAYEKLDKGELMLSPDSVWQVKLALANPGSGKNHFNELEKYSGFVNLELVGTGSYFDEQNMSDEDKSGLSVDCYYNADDTIPIIGDLDYI